MIPPSGMAIMAATVMLWILWSDTIRKQRPSQILYAMRIALFLVVSGMMILNLVRYPGMFPGISKLFAIAAVAIGIVGAAYFARRLVRRV